VGSDVKPLYGVLAVKYGIDDCFDSIIAQPTTNDIIRYTHATITRYQVPGTVHVPVVNLFQFSGVVVKAKTCLLVFPTFFDEACQ
jgi:hypothetical protein